MSPYSSIGTTPHGIEPWISTKGSTVGFLFTNTGKHAQITCNWIEDLVFFFFFFLNSWLTFRLRKTNEDLVDLNEVCTKLYLVQPW